MEFTFDQIRELIEFAKNQGISHLKIGELQISFVQEFKGFNMEDLIPEEDKKEMFFRHTK